MKIFNYLSAATLLLVISALWAADKPAMLEKPSFSASHSITHQATVETIDHATREVSLRMEDGELYTFKAGDEIRNLDQLKVGDIVITNYEETLSIQVVANEGMEPGESTQTSVARAKKGEKPGMAAIDTTTVTATVEEINLENNTVKLKGPDGEITEYEVEDPEKLKRAEVGDLVIITVTESMVMSIKE